MGNICFGIENDNYLLRKRTWKCSKCGDIYNTTHGKYSERTSCRFHELDENNYCRGCRRFIIKGQNCYHY